MTTYIDFMREKDEIIQSDQVLVDSNSNAYLIVAVSEAGV
jgi:hypothetical protein